MLFNCNSRVSQLIRRISLVVITTKPLRMLHHRRSFNWLLIESGLPPNIQIEVEIYMSHVFWCYLVEITIKNSVFCDLDKRYPGIFYKKNHFKNPVDFSEKMYLTAVSFCDNKRIIEVDSALTFGTTQSSFRNAISPLKKIDKKHRAFCVSIQIYRIYNASPKKCYVYQIV